MRYAEQTGYWLRWMLAQSLTLMALPGLLGVGVGAEVLVWAALAVAIVSLVNPRLIVRSRWLTGKIAGVGILTWVAVDLVLSGGDILPPFVRTLLLLVIVRSLQYRNGREDLQLLILNFLLLVVSGILNMELYFGLQLLAFGLFGAGVLTLVSIHESEGRSEDTRQPFAQFRWRSFAGTLWAGLRVHGRYLRFVSILYAGALLSVGLLFVALPRFELGHSLPFLRMQGGQSLTGFSDNVRYGDIVDILEDPRIAMRVDVEGAGIPAQPYWRMSVLDEYYDGGFRLSESLDRTWRELSTHRLESVAVTQTPGEAVWTTYLEPGVSRYLPRPGPFQLLEFNHRTDLQVQHRTQALRQRAMNAGTLFFRFSGVANATHIEHGYRDRQILELNALAVEPGAPSPGYPQTLLAFPGGAANTAVLEAALAAIGHQADWDVGRFAAAAVDWLQRGRGYSLSTEIAPGEADTVVRWIAQGGAGHCELYAGAFVLLARYAGYAARLVTGFAGGDWNGYEGYFMVRNRHAHAWAEVFDPGNGWLRVDPTPGGGGDAEVTDALQSGSMLADMTFLAYIDSLRVLWYRRVIQFDAQDQVAIGTTLRDGGVQLGTALWSQLQALWSQARAGISSLAGEVRWLQALLLGCTLAAAAALLWGLARALARWRLRLGGHALVRARAERWIRTARAALGAHWRTLPESPHIERLRYGHPATWHHDPHTLLRKGMRSMLRKRKFLNTQGKRH